MPHTLAPRGFLIQFLFALLAVVSVCVASSAAFTSLVLCDKSACVVGGQRGWLEPLVMGSQWQIGI